MNIRNLFIIIIRILALSLFINSISSIVGQIGFSLTFERIGEMLVKNIFLVFVSQTLLALLLFRVAPRLVDWLKLTKHLDNDLIDIGSLNMSSLIRLSIIIICSLLIINNLPLLISDIFRTSNPDFRGEFTVDMNSMSWLSFAFKLILGIVLFRNSDSLSRYVMGKTED